MTLPGIGVLSLSAPAHPWALLLTLVPLGLLALYAWVQGQRRRRLLRYSDTAMLPNVSPRPAHRLQHLAVGAALLALLFLVFALAGPTHQTRIPRNRAVVMLVIDVSESMAATDVEPTRLEAAKQAAKQFAEQLTPGVNLGLVSFAGNVNLLVSPTPDHSATVEALGRLRTDASTATGEAIFTALQAVSTVTAVLSSEQTTRPPARIVLLSDGEENKPGNPNNPRGAFTAARSAQDQGVPISTITFGTRYGFVKVNGESLPVPVNGDEMKQIAQLSGGQAFTAANVDELNRSYSSILEQVGYQTINAPSGAGWLRLAVLAATVATFAALIVNRTMPI